MTDVGHQLARELGMKLRGRLRRVHSSPLLRTMQTAERLAEGATRETAIVPDRMLGDPGAFVVDGRAGATWSELGHEDVMRRLVRGDDVLPGCADAEAAARALVQHMLAASHGAPGVHAFVTHDSLVTATVARLLGEPLTKEELALVPRGGVLLEGGGRRRHGVHWCRAEHARDRTAALDRARAPDHRARRGTRQRGRPFGSRAGQRPNDQQSPRRGTVDRPVAVPETKGRLLTASRLLSPHGTEMRARNAVPRALAALVFTRTLLYSIAVQRARRSPTRKPAGN